MTHPRNPITRIEVFEVQRLASTRMTVTLGNKYSASRPRLVSLALFFLVLGSYSNPAISRAAGPWRGRVVDSETREPLNGVAVLAVWHRNRAMDGAVGWTHTGHIGSTETVTDSAGRFTIPSRNFFTFGIGFRVDGPQLMFFKAGYGGWRFSGRSEDLTGDGALVEMRALRTSQEQTNYLEGRWTREERKQLEQSWRHADRPENPFGIPYEEARGYEAAINEARAKLGLRPTSIGFPGLGHEYYRPTPPEDPGQAVLRRPSGIAIDGDGNVYVADTENHRIVKFNADLSVRKKWGTFGRSDGQLQSPRSVTVDRNGTIYVADWGNHRVQMYTAEGDFLGKWGELRYYDLGGSFTPTHLGATGSDEIIVFNSNRIYRFTSSGRLLSQFGEPFLFWAHTGTAVDVHGNVYGINDKYLRGEPPIIKFDSKGQLLAKWGQTGKERGQLSYPVELTVDADGRLYVADRIMGNARVLVYDAHGIFVDQIELPGIRSPSRLAVDKRGHIYVTDHFQPRVYKFGPFLPR